MPNLPSEVAAAGPNAIATYKRSLDSGATEAFAVMVALQRPPGTKGTDRAFMEGRCNNQQLDDMPQKQAEWLAREARAAGISIEGKYYCGGLADHRAWRDPEAWVSGNDDIRRVAQKRGKTVSGSVNYEAPPVPPKRTLIHEQIVQDEVRKLKKLNPRAKSRELREQVIEKHAYRAKGR